jgi:MerR family transcriptional regulator, light-induced transcriptional regulator
MEHIFSSKQVAEFLGVNESSVKRWADGGMLGCYRTPGGHRKFRKNDILIFSRKYSYELKSNNFPNQENAEAQEQTFNFEKIKTVLLMKLFKSSDDEILDYLYSLHLSGLEVTDLYDSVLGRTMKVIGEMWQRKDITIEQEHISSNKMTKVLIRLHGKLESKPRNGLTAFCGCLENEFHELPLLSVNNVLQYNGWNTIYAGVNLPVKSFISGIETYKPDIVCLSATIIEDKIRFERDVKKIANVSKAAGANFIIGGSAADNIAEVKSICYALVLSIKDLLKYTKDRFSV